jgi:polysaccharide export outer membrane protein
MHWKIAKYKKLSNRILLLQTAVLLMQFILVNKAICEESGRYLLATGDVIEISVWKDNALNKQIEIPPDGIISFPLIGDVDTAGMTVTMLSETVKKKISEYIPDPTVTVILLKAVSNRAYVIGKVNTPGQFSITGGSNVMQILAMAGGLNPYADKKRILILRSNGVKTIKLQFNYNEVENGEHLEQNIILSRGDVVVVP